MNDSERLGMEGEAGTKENSDWSALSSMFKDALIFFLILSIMLLSAFLLPDPKKLPSWLSELVTIAGAFFLLSAATLLLLRSLWEKATFILVILGGLAGWGVALVRLVAAA